MQSNSAKWILWAATMAVFLWLTLTARWDWLVVAIVASWLLWYGVVPEAGRSDNRTAGNKTR